MIKRSATQRKIANADVQMGLNCIPEAFVAAFFRRGPRLKQREMITNASIFICPVRRSVPLK